ncbi:MAG: HD domain-containing protein [Planctomycetota bacterium]
MTRDFQVLRTPFAVDELAPPPISLTSMCLVAADIADGFGMCAALVRVDGRLDSATQPPWTLGALSGEEIGSEIHGTKAPRWYECPQSGWIRLVIPIYSRRVVWGHLVASYPCADEGTDGDDEPHAPPRIYLRAAADQLLVAVGNAVRSSILVRQQVDDLDELSGKMLESYEEISLLYRLGQHFNINLKPREILEFTCRELQRVLGSDRSVACMTASPTSKKEVNSPASCSTGSEPLSSSELKRLFDWYVASRTDWGEPIIDNGQGSFFRSADSPLSNGRRLILVPLCYQSELLGVLAATATNAAREFDSRDAQLMANLATQIGAHWKNFLLFDELRELLFSLIRALVSAIDAKDPYTFGHSERVAYVARRIAEVAAIDGEEIEDIYLSGLLHDIGKIGIREQVLLKPTKLSPDEWEHLRQHPDIGARILKPVAAIAKVVPGVQFHHECMNGNGYPRGLKGEEIPRMARILAVADAFDAMSTDRPYRRALSLLDMRNVFQAGAGIQWDPQFVAILLHLLEDEDFLAKYHFLCDRRPTS